MNTIKVHTSQGDVEVRGFKAREMTEQKILSQTLLGEVDKRGRGMSAARIREAKIKAMADVYYETIAKGIVSHNFNLEGQSLPEFLGEMEPSDVDAIEAAQSEINNPGEDKLGNSDSSSKGIGKKSKTRKS